MKKRRRERKCSSASSSSSSSSVAVASRSAWRMCPGIREGTDKGARRINFRGIREWKEDNGDKRQEVRRRRRHVASPESLLLLPRRAAAVADGRAFELWYFLPLFVFMSSPFLPSKSSICQVGVFRLRCGAEREGWGNPSDLLARRPSKKNPSFARAYLRRFDATHVTHQMSVEQKNSTAHKKNVSGGIDLGTDSFPQIAT